MVCFTLAGAVFVGTVVEERGYNTVVKVNGTLFTVPTSDLRPFNTKKGK